MPICGSHVTDPVSSGGRYSPVVAFLFPFSDLRPSLSS
ncbi:unnamed protein product [Ciceribacter sp. T2.26MG-112.2]|nr:unnamed protein product [Ciceribacter naphthalenivorans]